jgi:hypothetical protein
MANPTTYFGWVMPTSSSLVTNLPADFNTIGQGVDTSMQDLLGGTTGQILSKTSGTNMDFTWINNDQGDITGITAGIGITVTDSTGPVPTVALAATTYSAKTASYTFADGDQGDIFSMNNATTQQFNIPTDATFNFAVGTEINVFWITGAGQPTIGAVTPGTTTVISTGATSATPKLRVANSGATCKKLAANSWIVFGDIS